MPSFDTRTFNRALWASLFVLLLFAPAAALASQCPETIVVQMKPSDDANAYGEISISPLYWDYSITASGLLYNHVYEVTVGTGGTYADEVTVAQIYVDYLSWLYGMPIYVGGSVAGLPPEFDIMRLRMAGYPDQMTASGANLALSPHSSPCQLSESASHTITGTFAPSTSSYTPNAQVSATLTPKYAGAKGTIAARFRGLEPNQSYRVSVGTGGTYVGEALLATFSTDANGFGQTNSGLKAGYRTLYSLPSSYDIFRVRSSSGGSTLSAGTGSDIKSLSVGESTGDACYRTEQFSEEESYAQGATRCAPGFGVRGISCGDSYCDDKVLTCCQYSESPGKHLDWLTIYTSEEDPPQYGRNSLPFPAPTESTLLAEQGEVSGQDKILSGLQCSGSYCDDVLGLYTSANEILDFTGEEWSPWGSEEEGFIGCDEGKFAIGFECSGSYCDSMRLRCATPSTSVDLIETSDERVERLAEKFHPVLAFDQDSEGKCYPADPVDYHHDVLYYESRGPDCSRPLDSSVPIYYEYQVRDAREHYQQGERDEYIMYWIFYENQDLPAGVCSQGDHWGDWERVMVKVTGGMLAKVMYFAHAGWTTRMSGFTASAGPHPVAYVGKDAHGSYHNQGGNGGCEYWNDYRNPGPDPKVFWFDNLQRLPVLPAGEDYNDYWSSFPTLSEWGWLAPLTDWDNAGGIAGPKREEVFSDYEVCEGTMNVTNKAGCTGPTHFDNYNMGSGTF